MDSESNGPSTWGLELARAERILAGAGISSPDHEAATLLSRVLRVSIPEMLARPASHMSQPDVRAYRAWVARRAAGEALPYITGHLEFMGLDMAVAPGGPLIAPGARRVVETALEWARRRPDGELTVAEPGTGCGAVALALAALEPRFTHIYALDASASAIEVAHANGARYLLNLVIGWLRGEGLNAIPEPVDLIVACDLSWARSEPATEKLRPGGAVICAVAAGATDAAAERLTRCFPGVPLALSWVEDQGDGIAITVASRRPDSDAIVLES